MKRCMIYAVIVLFLLPLCGMAKKRTSKEERTNNHSAFLYYREFGPSVIKGFVYLFFDTLNRSFVLMESNHLGSSFAEYGACRINGDTLVLTPFVYSSTFLYLTDYIRENTNLDDEQIEKEMQAIAKTGLQEILILTGESKKMSDVEYIGRACQIARKYFKVIGLEIYPVNSDEYAYLHECGADYVTVFQETYNSDKYETLHLAGHKRIFPYRVNAQERALKGGMRGVGFGALLGLDDFRKDAFATGYHAYLLQRKYPHAEIAFSCPRLRPIINNDRINPMDVHETQLLQVVCAYRLFMPFASITVSTRECARVRDNLVQIAATKISAGVSTGIGSHAKDIEDKGDDQFEISDGRSVDEIYNDLLKVGMQPVMSDYIYV